MCSVPSCSWSQIVPEVHSLTLICYKRVPFLFSNSGLFYFKMGYVDSNYSEYGLTLSVCPTAMNPSKLSPPNPSNLEQHFVLESPRLVPNTKSLFSHCLLLLGKLKSIQFWVAIIFSNKRRPRGCSGSFICPVLELRYIPRVQCASLVALVEVVHVINHTVYDMLISPYNL